MGGRLKYPVYKWTRHTEKCKTRERAYVFAILFCTFLADVDHSFSVDPMEARVATTEHRWLLHRNAPLDEMKSNVGNS